MAYDVNLVVLIGRLTRDPELSYTKQNTALCKFSIANNRGTQQNPKVNFFNITTWANIATTCSQYLKKGSQVHITGELKQDRWTDESGQNKSRIEVTGLSVQFIGGNRDDSQDGPPPQEPQQQQTGTPPQQTGTPPQEPQQQQTGTPPQQPPQQHQPAQSEPDITFGDDEQPF